MGLLDSILASVMGGGAQQAQGSGQAALINAVIQLIAHRQGGGAAGGAAALDGAGAAEIGRAHV